MLNRMRNLVDQSSSIHLAAVLIPVSPHCLKTAECGLQGEEQIGIRHLRGTPSEWMKDTFSKNLKNTNKKNLSFGYLPILYVSTDIVEP